jgi:hypothetical protein
MVNASASQVQRLKTDLESGSRREIAVTATSKCRPVRVFIPAGIATTPRTCPSPAAASRVGYEDNRAVQPWTSSGRGRSAIDTVVLALISATAAGSRTRRFAMVLRCRAPAASCAHGRDQQSDAKVRASMELTTGRPPLPWNEFSAAVVAASKVPLTVTPRRR